jgi:hypothetical protein
MTFEPAGVGKLSEKLFSILNSHAIYNGCPISFAKNYQKLFFETDNRSAEQKAKLFQIYAKN